MAKLVERNPGEPEFHQSVREVIRDLLPFVESHGDYKREKKGKHRATLDDRLQDVLEHLVGEFNGAVFRQCLPRH